MNTPLEQLDTMRALAGRVKNGILRGMGMPASEGRPVLQEAAGLAANLETRLEQAGAVRPRALPQPDAVPLELLDTPANRRYRDALAVAWQAGLAVDRERYGDKIGTDGCAQVIEMVLADVVLEIDGPGGRDETRVGR